MLVSLFLSQVLIEIVSSSSAIATFSIESVLEPRSRDLVARAHRSLLILNFYRYSGGSMGSASPDHQVKLLPLSRLQEEKAIFLKS